MPGGANLKSALFYPDKADLPAREGKNAAGLHYSKRIMDNEDSRAAEGLPLASPAFLFLEKKIGQGGEYGYQ
jgi:hypothetical protein